MSIYLNYEFRNIPSIVHAILFRYNFIQLSPFCFFEVRIELNCWHLAKLERFRSYNYNVVYLSNLLYPRSANFQKFFLTSKNYSSSPPSIFGTFLVPKRFPFIIKFYSILYSKFQECTSKSTKFTFTFYYYVDLLHMYTIISECFSSFFLQK